MASSLIERVLDSWDRGAGLDPNRRADLVLQSMETGKDLPAVQERAVYERDGALLALHGSLFGPTLDAVVRCPTCLADFELKLDLAMMERAQPSPRAIRVEVNGYAVLVRPPQGRDLDAFSDDLRADDLADVLFARCVIEATCGSDIIDAGDLPSEVRAAAAAALSAHGMEGPTLDLECGECAHAWRAPLDIARSLLAELEDWVARLLDDVHRLAAAYHWSERDILALPLRRRLHYLRAIG